MNAQPHLKRYKFLLVILVGISLLVSQLIGVHMHLHIQHQENVTAAVEHFVAVHASSGLHPGHNDKVLHIDLATGHHATALDIIPDNLTNKAGSIMPLLLLVLIFRLFLKPLWQIVSRHNVSQTAVLTCYYLLNPPLRAPPLN